MHIIPPHMVILAIGLVAAIAAMPVTAAAQLASRPAEEWVKVLDSAERLEGLEIDQVISSLELRPGDVVADLGAGSGPFVVAFARAVPKGKVYAVDIDRGFFPYIEKRAQAAGVGNVQTVLGEATDPKLPARDVDVAFFHDVLHHVENRAAYLKSLVTYLRPGARIVVIDYHPAQSPHRDQPALQVSKEQAAAWLADAGFKPVRDVAVYPDKWFTVFAR